MFCTAVYAAILHNCHIRTSNVGLLKLSLHCTVYIVNVWFINVSVGRVCIHQPFILIIICECQWCLFFGKYWKTDLFTSVLKVQCLYILICLDAGHTQVTYTDIQRIDWYLIFKATAVGLLWPDIVLAHNQCMFLCDWTITLACRWFHVDSVVIWGVYLNTPAVSL